MSDSLVLALAVWVEGQRGEKERSFRDCLRESGVSLSNGKKDLLASSEPDRRTLVPHYLLYLSAYVLRTSLHIYLCSGSESLSHLYLDRFILYAAYGGNYNQWCNPFSLTNRKTLKAVNEYLLVPVQKARGRAVLTGYACCPHCAKTACNHRIMRLPRG